MDRKNLLRSGSSGFDEYPENNSFPPMSSPLAESNAVFPREYAMTIFDLFAFSWYAFGIKLISKNKAFYKQLDI